jgi:Na+/H+-dicarboxylate symporter/ABC-type amino acid transport substrate-binding protein
MSSTTRIVLGLSLGVATGLFFGEHVRPLQVVADGFVRLLQMSVLPYVTVSLVSSIGSLDMAQAKRLGVRVGLVLAGLWVVALGVALLFPLAFPDVQKASFFSSSMIERRQPFDLVALYIPSNPFHSLANGIVPAVVLFSTMLGVALIGVDSKKTILDLLAVVTHALSRVTRFIVGLTPYGLFAIAAVAAGTLDLAKLQKIELFVVTYAALAAVVGLWLLPGLVGALTPIRHRTIFAAAHDALITAFITGELFIVLPALIDASGDLLRRHDIGPGAEALPDAVVPVSFNFPGVGKLMSLGFVLFAAWYADTPIPVAQLPRLAITGLLTFFGSLNAAMPFLLDTFRIPADTFQLFLMTSVVNARVGTLIAAVHTLAVALLGSCAVHGAIRFDVRRLLTFGLITVALFSAALGGTRLAFSALLRRPYEQDQIVAGMRLSLPSAPAAPNRSSGATDAEPTAVLDRLHTGLPLRVGYTADRLPYAFLNRRGELVGLDVEMAHQLARELQVPVTFVPVTVGGSSDPLADGRCDIVMAGVKVTPLRAARMRFSSPYLDETLGIVVPDDQREEFLEWDTIRARGASLRVAVSNTPYYVEKVRRLLPDARITVVDEGVRAIFSQLDSRYDAAVLGAEMASAWTLLYPRFSVVVPGPDVLKLPLAYALPRNDDAWASFVNTWIMLKQRDGTVDGLYKHWILGQAPSRQTPRWSILHDVLGWGRTADGQ